ncbi:MAG: hypothetical protein II625_07605 [Bacilli bacterium]|nr:hypothetical protein [Bacilli bacterium]
MKNEDSGKSVLEEVWEEKNVELNFFDALIVDPSDFLNHLIVVLPDDQIIRFYDYLVKRQRKLESPFNENGKETIEYGNVMTLIMKLEELEVIETHKKELEAEAEIVTEQIMKNIEERQKVKKMGPIRRALYNRRKNNR